MKVTRFRCSIGRMCHLLGVSKSGYYNWLNRKPSKRAQEEGRLEVEIKWVAGHINVDGVFRGDIHFAAHVLNPDLLGVDAGIMMHAFANAFQESVAVLERAVFLQSPALVIKPSQ